MPWFLPLLFVIGFGTTTKKVSVAELTAQLAGTHSEQTSDALLATQLAHEELTERLTADTLAKLQHQAPGRQTTAVLHVLAAQSTFLKLPAAELLPLPPATPDQQQQILARTRAYVVGYVHALPDFFCRETVFRFDSDKQYPARGKRTVGNLRFRDDISAEASYFEHKERVEYKTINGESARADHLNGLQTHGEFGNILVLLFMPQSHTKVSFDHWETSAGRHIAVFAYAVNKPNSVYQVQTARRNLWQDALEPVTLTEGYRGHLSVDADTGAILRITLAVVDLPDTYLMQNIQTSIDYAPVEIAGKVFICPERTVTQSNIREPVPGTHTVYNVRTLNQTIYSDYRRYQTESKLVFGGAEIAAAKTVAQTSDDSALLPQIVDLDAPTAPTSASATLPSLPAPTLAAELGVPDLPPPPAPSYVPPAAAPLPEFKAGLNEVIVPVVVRDRKDLKGHAVGGLTRDDFEVFDRGRKQDILSFSIRDSSAPVGATPSRYIALVFDDLRMSADVISQVSAAAQRFIREMAVPGPAIAVYSLAGKPMLDFTTDRDKILDALAHLRASPRGSVPATCPTIGFFQAKAIFDHTDPQALTAAASAAMALCGIPVQQSDYAQRSALQAARVALAAGEYNSSVALNNMRVILHRLQAISGDRSLLFASPGFLTPADYAAFNTFQNLAVSSGIVMNTLNTGGVAVLPGYDAATTGKVDGGSLVEQQRWANLEEQQASETLALFATSTGGRSFRNNNSFIDGFRVLTESPGVVYLLTIKPQPEGKDLFHKLSVKVHGYSAGNIQARLGYSE